MGTEISRRQTIRLELLTEVRSNITRDIVLTSLIPVVIPSSKVDVCLRDAPQARVVRCTLLHPTVPHTARENGALRGRKLIWPSR